MKVLMLIEDGYEDVEFFYPYYRFKEAGFDVVVASPTPGLKVGKNGTKFKVELEVSDLDPKEFVAVFVPGGHAPDKLRRYEKVLEIVREIYEKGGVVGSICHGPHVLVSAGIVKGVKMTSFFSIKDDLINAGAEWVDESVVSDRRIVTSRVPDDLPKLMSTLIEEITNVKTLSK